MTDKHTPVTLEGTDPLTDETIIESYEGAFCRVTDRDFAEFILNSCNSHDKLVGALEFIASGERTDGSKHDKHDAIGFIGIAKEALAKVKGT